MTSTAESRSSSVPQWFARVLAYEDDLCRCYCRQARTTYRALSTAVGYQKRGGVKASQRRWVAELARAPIGALAISRCRDRSGDDIAGFGIGAVGSGLVLLRWRGSLWVKTAIFRGRLHHQKNATRSLRGVDLQDFHSRRMPARTNRVAVAFLHCGKLRLSLQSLSGVAIAPA